MRAGTVLALVLVLPILALVAGAGRTEAPATSIRPEARPAVLAPAAPSGSEPPLAPEAEAVPVPKPRPAELSAPQPEAAKTATAASAPAFPNRVIRPKIRPAGLLQTAAASSNAAAQPTAPAKKPKTSARGSVCGDPAIKGQPLSPITSRVKGCGVPEPVQITAVAGVVLNPAAILDCPTAQALRAWVEQGLQPAFRPNQVVELKIFGSYMCRTQNNQRGAKVSEHGRGKAVDIGGFGLSNGETVTVAGNFNAPVRKAHKAACGIFGTTLGPGSDGYHEDHLHFDTASYRSGSYCR